jgi:hypothetical protein
MINKNNILNEGYNLWFVINNANADILLGKRKK